MTLSKSMAEWCSWRYRNSCRSRSHFHSQPLNWRDRFPRTSCLISTIHRRRWCSFLAVLRMFYRLNCRPGNWSSSRKFLLGTRQHSLCQCNIFLVENNKCSIQTGTRWPHRCCKWCSKKSWYRCCILSGTGHKFAPCCSCNNLQGKH